MKAQAPVSPQSTLLNLRVVSSAGAARGEPGEAVRAAQTTRPVIEPEKLERGSLRAREASPAREPVEQSASQKTQLRFSVDEPSGRMVVSIVDRDTSEVVRQIPAEEMLAIARQIEERLRDAGTTDGLFVTGEA
jgi:flagellar protein FlaG